MKIILSSLLLLLGCIASQAQELKKNEVTFADYQSLLEAEGYQAYSFDISALKGKNISLHFKEYIDGKEVESDINEIMPYTFGVNGDKLVFGALPAKCDSLINFCISIEKTVKFAYSLKRKPLVVEGVSRYDSYRTEAFELTTPLNKETFIPLVMYSSFWYDAEHNVTRCCGTASDIAQHSPHYYAIGFIIH